MAHHEKTGNDSKIKFAVIFALLFFFGVTVAGQRYFVGSEGGESAEHAASSDEAATAPADDADAPEKHKSSGRKKH
jgi:hypothetical protein